MPSLSTSQALGICQWSTVRKLAKVQYPAPPTNFVGGVFLIDTGTELLHISLDQVQVSKSLDVCDLHVALVLPPTIGVTKVAQTVGV